MLPTLLQLLRLCLCLCLCLELLRANAMQLGGQGSMAAAAADACRLGCCCCCHNGVQTHIGLLLQHAKAPSSSCSSKCCSQWVLLLLRFEAQCLQKRVHVALQHALHAQHVCAQRGIVCGALQQR